MTPSDAQQVPVTFGEGRAESPTLAAQRLCAFCGQRARSALEAPHEVSHPACGNDWCGAADRPLGPVFAVGGYQGSLRKAVVAYKYTADLRWAPVFGALLHKFLVGHAAWFEELGPLCPVPAFSGPGARRPWGPVELVCSELDALNSRALGAGAWPVEHLVAKSRETPQLSAQARSSRARIARGPLAGAFVVPKPQDVAGRRVVVVDDVCASGQTLLAVARALRRAGACEVVGLVLARAAWRCPEP